VFDSEFKKMALEDDFQVLEAACVWSRQATEPENGIGSKWQQQQPHAEI